MFIFLQFDRTRESYYDAPNMFRGKLEKNLNDFQVTVIMALELYKQSIQFYSDSMMINRTKHFNNNDLQNAHQHTKHKAIEQVRFRSQFQFPISNFTEFDEFIKIFFDLI